MAENITDDELDERIYEELRRYCNQGMTVGWIETELLLKGAIVTKQRVQARLHAMRELDFLRSRGAGSGTFWYVHDRKDWRWG